jgi:hypothetical protein
MKAPVFGRPGLPEREFNRVLDGYLSEGVLAADQFATMNTDQANIIREISKSLRRIHYKINKDIYESTETQSI